MGLIIIMDVSGIISKSLEEYDRAQVLMKYISKNATYQVHKPINPNIQRTSYHFTDKNTGEKLFDTDGELLALYYNKFGIWSWAWANTNLSDGEVYFSKKLIHHAIDLSSDLVYIKSILITSRGLIKNPLQIDINLAVSSSIIKRPYIMVKKIKITEDPEDYINHYIVLLNNEALVDLHKKISLNT